MSGKKIIEYPTAAERAVLQDYTDGLTEPDICTKRGTKPGTINKQRKSINLKFGTDNIIDSVVIGLALGIVINKHKKEDYAFVK